MLSREEFEKINDEVRCSVYARNRIKSMGHELAEIMTKVEFAAAMMGDGLLSPELYAKIMMGHRKEVKDILAQTYTYLKLHEVEGHYDQAFVQSASQGGNKE